MIASRHNVGSLRCEDAAKEDREMVLVPWWRFLVGLRR